MVFGGLCRLLMENLRKTEKHEKKTKGTPESLQTTPKPLKITSNRRKLDFEWIWGGLEWFRGDFRSIFDDSSHIPK